MSHHKNKVETILTLINHHPSLTGARFLDIL